MTRDTALERWWSCQLQVEYASIYNRIINPLRPKVLDVFLFGVDEKVICSFEIEKVEKNEKVEKDLNDEQIEWTNQHLKKAKKAVAKSKEDYKPSTQTVSCIGSWDPNTNDKPRQDVEACIGTLGQLGACRYKCVITQSMVDLNERSLLIQNDPMLYKALSVIECNQR
eukprot:g5290.t1